MHRKKVLFCISSKLNTRKVCIKGSVIYEWIKKSKIPFKRFWRYSSLFHRDKNVSKTRLKQLIKISKGDKQLQEKLKKIYSTPLSLTKITKIEEKGIEPVIDIETKNHNFIANGILVHNSAHRFQQNRENLLVWWMKEIADNLRVLSENNRILLGGCAGTKSRLRKYLSRNVDKRVISEVDVGYTDEAGIWEIIDKSKDDVMNSTLIEEKALGDEFAKLLSKNPEMVDYGEKFDRSNVRMILVSEKNKNKFPDAKVVRHTVVDALGICVFKRY